MLTQEPVQSNRSSCGRKCSAALRASANNRSKGAAASHTGDHGAPAQRSATRMRLMSCLAGLILVSLLEGWRNIAAPLSGRLGGRGGCGPCLKSWPGEGWQAHRVQQGQDRSGKLSLPARLGEAIGNQEATWWRGSGGDKCARQRPKP